MKRNRVLHNITLEETIYKWFFIIYLFFEKWAIHTKKGEANKPPPPRGIQKRFFIIYPRSQAVAIFYDLLVSKGKQLHGQKKRALANESPANTQAVGYRDLESDSTYIQLWKLHGEDNYI